uniref:Tetratricopeptide SHNi-TPR domain-containing protein n=1 Tax=Panagrolaimus sp. ES5 TaxID=591445 RepID=A0AC34EZ35_9BILA
MSTTNKKMVAANDNTLQQPEINPEVPSEENVAAGDEAEIELTKEEKLAAIPNLMIEGQRAYLTNDLDTASEKFSIATEYAVTAYGDEFAPECFEPHFKYGLALVGIAALESEDPQVEFDSVRDYITKMAEERAQKLQGVKEQPNLDDSRVGNSDEITGEEREEIIAAVDNALEENAQELDKLGEKSEETKEEIADKKEESIIADDAKEKTPEACDKTDGDKTEAKEEAADASVEIEDKEDVDMDKTVDITEGDVEMEDGDEDEEDIPSANIAWEVLEVARKICEKQGESKEWDLKKAQVCSVLGQLLLTEDKYEEAIGDLQTALDITQKHLDENDRLVASSYYELGVAYRSNDDYLRAAELMKKAKDILTACFEKVKAAGDTEEMKDLEEVIKDVTSAYEDCQGSHQDSERKKAEQVKEEVKQISPEKPKENLEPAADITSNIRKGKRPAQVEPEEAKKAKVEEEPAAEIPADPVA